MLNIGTKNEKTMNLSRICMKKNTEHQIHQENSSQKHINYKPKLRKITLKYFI